MLLWFDISSDDLFCENRRTVNRSTKCSNRFYRQKLFSLSLSFCPPTLDFWLPPHWAVIEWKKRQREKKVEKALGTFSCIEKIDTANRKNQRVFFQWFPALFCSSVEFNCVFLSRSPQSFTKTRHAPLSNTFTNDLEANNTKESRNDRILLTTR